MVQGVQTPALSLDDAHALHEARHGDPFGVLGPHDGRIRVIDPRAASVAVVTEDGGETELARVAEGVSVFDGAAAPKGHYWIRARADGKTWDYEDPFRFGPVMGDLDEYLLGEGTHTRLWTVLGAHVMEHEGQNGCHFAVWAPNAERVSVVGEFNGWDGRLHPMRRRGATGVWEIFLPDIGEGAVYKYEIRAEGGSIQPLKADPVGFGSQHPPENASVVRHILGYGWKDDAWMAARADRQALSAPISVYEVHLASWKRRVNEGNRPISYREAAVELVDYVHDMGFTHIELMPIHEHPFDGSWGYQPVGLYAPTIRFGPPHEFRDLVEAAHARDIGILIDWVPGHFPVDDHGLGLFDGTHLYEHADPREGFHQDWNTLIYNFGRTEVANFLTANALYWLEEYHLDGLRVDAVASMLYRDYSRKEGEWVPNKDGGNENYEAIALLKRMNVASYGQRPGIMTVAEESTSFPKVSRPVDDSGLGFGYKWNMGWMNDTLSYMAKKPIHRKYHHHQMTFGMHYAYSENFILPISHDEVVHGKGAMLGKMPGSETEKFANLRAYYGFMWGHPGKKLLFMGCEFAQPEEWKYQGSLPWHLLDDPRHGGIQRLVRDLNTLYRGTPALHALDSDPNGFQWIEADDSDASVYAWLRRSGGPDPEAVVVCNFTPVERRYPLGFPSAGRWREALNTDAEVYGGGGRGNMGGVEASAPGRNGQAAQAEVTLPPLTTLIFVKDT